MSTAELVLGVFHDQARTGKKSVHLDGTLALFDGLKLAQDIGVLPQASAQRRLSLLEVGNRGWSSLFQPRGDSVQRDENMVLGGRVGKFGEW